MFHTVQSWEYDIYTHGCIWVRHKEQGVQKLRKSFAAMTLINYSAMTFNTSHRSVSQLLRIPVFIQLKVALLAGHILLHSNEHIGTYGNIVRTSNSIYNLWSVVTYLCNLHKHNIAIDQTTGGQILYFYSSKNWINIEKKCYPRILIKHFLSYIWHFEVVLQQIFQGMRLTMVSHFSIGK